MQAAPLILTLGLEDAAQARFDALRRQHFPAERNFIPAHVTLFHDLPGAEERAIAEEITLRCAETARFPVRVAGLRFLGRGVAYSLESRELAELRAALARAWAPWLTAQDRQGFRPHLTIQNKAAPEAARALLAALEAEFSTFDVLATGLLLWHYRGGPWDEAGRFTFKR